jgi:GT2 family glycosyltransferase
MKEKDGSGDLLRQQLARQSAVLEQLLRRADDIEAALYELKALHGVSSTAGADTSQRLANVQALTRIREIVREAVPAEASILVIGKGDPELLKMHGRKTGHFPQAEDGSYAGSYPKTSTAAIAHLEALRARGADYLVIPASAFWWLEHYKAFGEHLARRYVTVADSAQACRIYALREVRSNDAGDVWSQFHALLAQVQDQYNRAPSILDWNSGLSIAAQCPHHTVFSPPDNGHQLPYLENSVDIVAVGSTSSATLAEARRVAQSAVAVISVAGASQSLAVEWRTNGKRPRPLSTSIIIPVYNNARDTMACVGSLRETLPADFAGEILIVDDASTDGTRAALKALAASDKRVRVITLTKNAGFVTACNRGAKAATGDILLFLNNDTVLLPGWLPPLLRVFREDPKAGVVGGRLLCSDGRIQEAGGIIFRDGSAAHFGRGDYDTDGFLYQFVREVDYCSGAFLATPRKLFHEADGFDRRYVPAYYEDVDYCFKIRQMGHRVFYQPESTIVHFEGASCGVDPTRGVKRYMAINHQKFLDKWKAVLKGHPVRPAAHDTAAWQAVGLSTRAARA